MGIFDWIKNKETKTEFEKTFADLSRMSSIVPSAGKTFDLLKNLNSETTESQTDYLISEFNKIQYASKTNSTFYFYFPIVTHILYFKPEYEKDILRYLIGPNFANGTTNTEEMISLIQGAMKYKLSEKKEYLTKESQNWIMNILPKLENEVEHEIQKCWKELNE
ncbi:hypothetical protein [Aquimarina amphilecti]|uniref:hypothetical protein n=1 Tax=Aquimarina amphilecti TaxID=1038014 RepID=UPI000B82EB8B|nr:hypothetical protein [Aquimarina amphilecti]